MSGLEISGTMVGETAAGLILDSNYKTEFVVLIVWSSLWLGALGWEVFLSLTFDYRLLLETNWRSILSTIHSLAYYLSRYAMLTFITLFVRQSAAQSSDCSLTVVSTTSMLCVSVGATNLVFLLRTCAIWNMRWVAVVPLTITWLIILGFAITLPVVARTRQLAGYCIWNTGGFFVGAALVSIAAFGVVCFILTMMKLNRSGWKSAARGLLPHSKPNLDSEDVSVMLVQRTTAYFAIQLVLLIIVATVYFAGPMPYRLMNVVSFNAITSSMAGKIFRKSWRLTRYVNDESFNRPPSYYPGWADEEDDESDGTQTPPLSSMTRKKDADEFYVEGDFGGSKSGFHQQAAAASFYASHNSLPHRASHGGEDARSAEYDLESGRVGGQHGDSVTGASEVAGSGDVNSDAPQMRGKRHRRRARGSHRGRRRPSTEPTNGNRRFGEGEDMAEKLPVIMSTRVSSLKPKQARRRGEMEAAQSSERSEVYQPSIDQTLSPTSREDLNQAPIRSRLWLDSRAERARLEAISPPSAVAQTLLRPTSSTSILRSGTIGHSASVSYAPSTVSSSNTSSSRTGKRIILEDASEAGERLHGFQWKFADTEDRRPHTASFAERDTEGKRRESITPTSRASFLPSSPAIVSPPDEASRLDRRKFDFDAIRHSLQGIEQQTTSTAAMVQKSPRVTTLSIPALPLSPADIGNVEGTSQRRKEKSRAMDDEISPALARPKTAPSQPSIESVSQVTLTPIETPVVDSEAPVELDVLNAFRQVIEDDSIAVNSNRPTTSRGVQSRDSTMERRDFDAAITSDRIHTARRLSAYSDDTSELPRPGTSHGGSNLKPFGFQSSSREETPEPLVISAIEEQYKKLAAIVNAEEEEDDDDASSNRTARA